MSHTVNYQGFEPEEAYDAALKDCRNWLGDKYDCIFDLLSDTDSIADSAEGLICALSFAGIQGFPAHVMVFEATGKVIPAYTGEPYPWE